MHRFRSSSSIIRFRMASTLLAFGYLLGLSTVVLLVHSMLNNDRERTAVAIALGVLTGVVLALQWVIARRTYCPLCMTPVLAAKHCSKHRRARKLLGSHRLRAAITVLFRSAFTCPYCNERSELKVRERVR